MKKTLLSLTLASALIAGSAMAATTPSFDYISAAYATEKNDDYNERATGIIGEFSKTISDTNVYIYSDFSYATMDADIGVPSEITSTMMTAQAGYKFDLSTATAAFVRGGLAYYKAEADVATNGQSIISASDSANAFIAAIGIRHVVLQSLELEGNVSYSKSSEFDDMTVLNTSAKYYFSDAFSVNAGASFTDYSTGFNLGVGYHF